MKRIYGVYQAISILMILSSLSGGQGPATGTPPFGSFGGGPFDTVNLGNLNAHFAVSIIHKAGRGMSFDYDLSYDSSVWYPASVSGSQTWQPVVNWGWRGQTEVATGYVTYTSAYSGPACFFSGSSYGVQYTQSNWTYHDSFGAAHVFSGSTVRYAGAAAYCPPDTSMTATTGDDSGWTLSATGTNLSKVTSASGKLIHPPV